MRSHILCDAKRRITIIMALGCLMAGCPCPDEPERDYRQDMRAFVQAISAYAKSASPGFLVIPQNGEALITSDGDPAGEPVTAYLSAIDGLGREDLFFGYDGDNVPTPAAAREEMIEFLQIAERQGVQALVTDYCSTPASMDQSYAANAAQGFASFASDRRELDHIPGYPAQPYQQNPLDITGLAQVRNFLYLLNPGAYANRQTFVDALAATDFDLLLVDLFFEEEPLTPQDIAALRHKAHGGRRLIIAYMSIGEAETYRYYWQNGWRPGAPEWLEDENPDWEGNYKVRYWDPEWQAIIFGAPNAYLDRILAAGFDGVYLDIIDAYEYFEEEAR